MKFEMDSEGLVFNLEGEQFTIIDTDVRQDEDLRLFMVFVCIGPMGLFYHYSLDYLERYATPVARVYIKEEPLNHTNLGADGMAMLFDSY